MTPPHRTVIGVRNRVDQGDIIKDVEMTEYSVEDQGILQTSYVVFPHAVVLSQACDLESDFAARHGRPRRSPSKLMLTALVAPLYNADQVLEGSHLQRLGISLPSIDGKRDRRRIAQNDSPRYHYLEFPEDVQIADSIIDFKHYFSVNVEILRLAKRDRFLTRLGVPYREELSQRFSAWLSRVGLP